MRVCVVLAAMSRDTETTITVVLPLLADFSRRDLFMMACMWGLVGGTALVALLSYAQVMKEI